MKEQLVRRVIEKQNKLLNDLTVEKELLYEALPIVWFGNSSSDKEKILTLGANPSRWEYLDKKLILKEDFADRNKVERAYLKNGKERFIKNSAGLNITDAINSFDSYFENNPYSGWFGKKHPASKAEAFLNGMDASYYNNSDKTYQACHIDLFPFVTLRDFKNIQDIVSVKLFENGWAKDFLYELLAEMKPKCLVILGSTNVKYFEQYISGKQPKLGDLLIDDKEKKVKYYEFDSWKFPVIGISTNLGNPTCSNNVGLSSTDLIAYGKKIKTIAGF